MARGDGSGPGPDEGDLEELAEALLSLLAHGAATERAVFLLRRGFGLDRAETARVVAASVEECRRMERDAETRLRAACDCLTRARAARPPRPTHPDP